MTSTWEGLFLSLHMALILTYLPQEFVMYSFPKVNHTQWKSASKKTLVELVVRGKLNMDQIQAVIFSGVVSKVSIRRAMWKAIRAQTTTKTQMDMVKRFYPLLHG